MCREWAKLKLIRITLTNVSKLEEAAATDLPTLMSNMVLIHSSSDASSSRK